MCAVALCWRMRAHTIQPTQPASLCCFTYCRCWDTTALLSPSQAKSKVFFYAVLIIHEHALPRPMYVHYNLEEPAKRPFITDSQKPSKKPKVSFALYTLTVHIKCCRFFQFIFKKLYLQNAPITVGSSNAKSSTPLILT